MAGGFGGGDVQVDADVRSDSHDDSPKLALPEKPPGEGLAQIVGQPIDLHQLR